MAELNLKHLSTFPQKSSKYIEDTLAKKNLSEQANKRLYTG